MRRNPAARLHRRGSLCFKPFRLSKVSGQHQFFRKSKGRGPGIPTSSTARVDERPDNRLPRRSRVRWIYDHVSRSCGRLRGEMKLSSHHRRVRPHHMKTKKVRPTQALSLHRPLPPSLVSPDTTITVRTPSPCSPRRPALEQARPSEVPCIPSSRSSSHRRSARRSERSLRDRD